MSIRFSPEADQDISNATSYVSEKNPIAADRLYEKLMALLTKLESRQFEGPEKRLKTGEKVRAWPSERWWVYYKRSGEELYVLRIYPQVSKPLARKPRRKK